MKKIIPIDDYNCRIGGEVMGAITTTFAHLALRNGWKIIEIHDTKDKMAKIYRIRKLTPRECFRLMGVSDLDISKIQNYPLVTEDRKTFNAPDGIDSKTLKQLAISESQQYKLAGNSIVVQVLEGIFTQLFRADTDSLF